MDYNVRAIVLTRMQVGERDVLATYFTRERGRVQAIVRGTAKTVSSLRPGALPMNEGDALIVERRGTDLLTEWVPVDAFPGVSQRLGSLCLAGYMLRLTADLTPPFQPDPFLYNLLKLSLSGLQKYDFYDIMKLVFEWGFLHISGLSFDLNACVNCGNTCRGADRVVLDISGGGILCPQCLAGAKPPGAMSLSLDTVQLGNMINEVLSRISGDVYVGEEPLASFHQSLHGLHHENHKAGGKPAAQLQKAVSRFIQFHMNESAPSWHVQI
jgi:DNA repair protein RecO (recombination protein O)